MEPKSDNHIQLLSIYWFLFKMVPKKSDIGNQKVSIFILNGI